MAALCFGVGAWSSALEKYFLLDFRVCGDLDVVDLNLRAWIDGNARFHREFVLNFANWLKRLLHLPSGSPRDRGAGASDSLLGFELVEVLRARQDYRSSPTRVELGFEGWVVPWAAEYLVVLVLPTDLRCEYVSLCDALLDFGSVEVPWPQLYHHPYGYRCDSCPCRKIDDEDDSRQPMRTTART